MIVGVVVSEMLISSAGIGYLISRYRTILDSPHVFAGVLLVIQIFWGALVAGLKAGFPELLGEVADGLGTIVECRSSDFLETQGSVEPVRHGIGRAVIYLTDDTGVPQRARLLENVGIKPAA